MRGPSSFIHNGSIGTRCQHDQRTSFHNLNASASGGRGKDTILRTRIENDPARVKLQEPRLPLPLVQRVQVERDRIDLKVLWNGADDRDPGHRPGTITHSHYGIPVGDQPHHCQMAVAVGMRTGAEHQGYAFLHVAKFAQQ
jgi:hypothetical protein